MLRSSPLFVRIELDVCLFFASPESPLLLSPVAKARSVKMVLVAVKQMIPDSQYSVKSERTMQHIIRYVIFGYLVLVIFIRCIFQRIPYECSTP